MPNSMEGVILSASLSRLSIGETSSLGENSKPAKVVRKFATPRQRRVSGLAPLLLKAGAASTANVLQQQKQLDHRTHPHPKPSAILHQQSPRSAVLRDTQNLRSPPSGPRYPNRPYRRENDRVGWSSSISSSSTTSHNCSRFQSFNEPKNRYSATTKDLDGDEVMAELDTHRGHGGAHHQRNRKRRYRDEDEYDRRPQRRRYDEPTVAKLRKQMLAVAESPMKDAQDDVRDIARGLVDNFEDEEVKAAIIDLAVQLVLEQPFKIPFTAAIFLYANQTKPDVAQEALARAGAKLQVSLEAGNWRDVKLLLRFFACSQSLLEGDGVFPILDELFNRAVDMQAASQEDAVGVELVKIILLTIPYLLASPATGFEQKALDMLEKTDIVATAPHPLELLVEPYSGEKEERPFEYQSLIGLLQKQLQRESSRDWELACIPRVFAPHASSNGADGATPAKHPFPAVTVPSPVNPGPKPLFPEAFFSLYADQEVESVPRTDVIACSLLRDALVDTINILDYNRTATAKFLIDLDCYWAPDTFVKRATAFDKLKDVAGDKSTWKPEDMVVDAVFSQMFVLPSAEHKLVYYHSVITESCKVAPAAIAPSLGRAIRFLYRNLDSMDMELTYRFMDWFTHHLSNFEFRWKWTEWQDEIPRPELDPKKAFIVGVLDKEIRLSFAKRIRSTLPEEYHPLIPEAKDKDTPDFKFDSDTVPYASEGRKLLALLKKKAPEEEIEEVIKLIHDQAAEHGVTDVLVPSTDAYVTCICFIGSKSLSHVLSCIERCKERLLALGPQSESARRQIITSVTEYWKDQPGIAVNIVDKLLNYTILSPICVLQWALNDCIGSGSLLSHSWAFEMVAGTVGKVTNRIRQIVAARLQKGLPTEQVDMLIETLDKERDDMRQLFALIEDSVVGIATGAADGFIEADGTSAMTDENAKLVKAWGERWARVFRRKAAVEEAVVGEAAVEAKVRLLGVEDAIENGSGDMAVDEQQDTTATAEAEPADVDADIA